MAFIAWKYAHIVPYTRETSLNMHIQKVHAEVKTTSKWKGSAALEVVSGLGRWTMWKFSSLL